MRTYFSTKFNKHICEIFSGNYFSTRKKDIIIATLLGSCVAACLRDVQAGVIGMNHFLLPGDFSRSEVVTSPDARYGMHAMEILINSMMKQGASRDRLEAKVFGGGHILDANSSKIPENNVKFIKAYLSMEEIPIIAEDLGGTRGRKILFFADTTDVFLKRIQNDKVYRQDQHYLGKIKSKGDWSGELTLFE